MAHIVPFGQTLGTFYSIQYETQRRPVMHLPCTICHLQYLSSVLYVSMPLMHLYMCLYVLFLCMVNIYISIEDLVIHVP